MFIDLSAATAYGLPHGTELIACSKHTHARERIRCAHIARTHTHIRPVRTEFTFSGRAGRTDAIVLHGISAKCAMYIGQVANAITLLMDRTRAAAIAFTIDQVRKRFP